MYKQTHIRNAFTHLQTAWRSCPSLHSSSDLCERAAACCKAVLWHANKL